MRYIIRAMSKRQPYIDYLKYHLPDGEYLIDISDNAMDTFLHALGVAGIDATVHMEEDCILTRNFQEKIETAIAARPGDVINFFSRRKADLEIGSPGMPRDRHSWQACVSISLQDCHVRSWTTHRDGHGEDNTQRDTISWLPIS